MPSPILLSYCELLGDNDCRRKAGSTFGPVQSICHDCALLATVTLAELLALVSFDGTASCTGCKDACQQQAAMHKQRNHKLPHYTMHPIQTKQNPVINSVTQGEWVVS